MIRRWLRARLNAVYRRSLTVADRLDRRRGFASAGAVARGWALLKLVVLAITAPLSGAALGAMAARNRRALHREITDFAAVVDDLARTATTTRVPTATRSLRDPASTPPAGRRLATLPTSDRYFIVGDLHRSPPGTNDLPHLQETAALYAAALDHYAGEGWTLVENGDAEEFWLLGGSTYGVHYDLWRTAAALSGRRGRRLRRRVRAEHLRRIVGNNSPVYRRIRSDFVETGRYVRLAGNHDDLLDRPEGVAELQRWLPGVAVWDVVVLTEGDRAAAVVTHGHLPDSWNAPGRNRPGKFAGVWASALYDAPWVSARPGVATPTESEALLDGTDDNRLVAVNPVLGAGLDLFTTDEVLLARSYRLHWPEDGSDPAPLLVLGHTHAPRLDALGPGGRRWHEYLNGGCGVHHRLVTGIEWDGTGDVPSVSLVGWHHGLDGIHRRELRRLDHR